MRSWTMTFAQISLDWFKGKSWKIYRKPWFLPSNIGLKPVNFPIIQFYENCERTRRQWHSPIVWTTDCQVEHLGWHFLWRCLIGLSQKQQEIIWEVPKLKVDRFHHSHQGLLSQLMWLHTHVLPMPHRQVTWSTHDTLHGNGTHQKPSVDWSEFLTHTHGDPWWPHL